MSRQQPPRSCLEPGTRNLILVSRHGVARSPHGAFHYNPSSASATRNQGFRGGSGCVTAQFASLSTRSSAAIQPPSLPDTMDSVVGHGRSISLCARSGHKPLISARNQRLALCARSMATASLPTPPRTRDPYSQPGHHTLRNANKDIIPYVSVLPTPPYCPTDITVSISRGGCPHFV